MLRDSRVLVTGGAGFLGRRVVEQLRAAGAAEITVPRRRECDLTDAGAVHRLFRETRPELVFHLAAEVGGIGANRLEPGRFFYANMAMGLHLVDEARRADIRKFVTVGTVCAYPRVVPVPFCEEDLWSGYPEETNAPYGIAKRALLVMLQAYRKQYGLRGIALLPTNLFGPGEDGDLERSHVIPALIRKCLEARRRGERHITCWGTGRASRDFLYVDDCAEAIVLAAERYDGREPVNVGTGREITIRELAQRVAALTGFDGDIEWDASKPDGQPRRCLDVSRAEKEFGFRARVPFDEALRATVEWHAEKIGMPV